MTARLHYLCAVWPGERLNEHPAGYEPTRYLRAQVAALSTLRHRLAQITFVVNRCEPEPPAFTAALAAVPRLLRDTPVVVQRRDTNAGVSYGAFDAGFAATAGQFDAHLLVEDDYVFGVDDFDEIMWEGLTPGVGFACAWVDDQGNCAHFIGIGRDAALRAVRQAHGRLPYADPGDTHAAQYGGQRAYTPALRDVGWYVGDLSRRWRSEFWAAHVRTYGPPQAPVLIRTVQGMP